MRVARKHIGWYARGLPGGEAFRASRWCASTRRPRSARRSTTTSRGWPREPRQRARRRRAADPRALLQGPGRRAPHRHLRHGAQARREADARGGAGPRRGQPDAAPPRCSASTATRCARRCSSCASKGERAAPGADQRLRQDRRRRVRPRARGPGRRAAVHRRHGEAAREGRRAGDRGRRRTPAFPRCSTAASRRCTRRSTAACSRGATCPRTWRRWRATASRRSTCVVVNLYPFEATVADPDCTLEDAIENIDIGGPAMVRAAAKNHAARRGADRPGRLRGACWPSCGATAAVSATRRASRSPTKAFAHTAAYDGAIADYLSSLRRRRHAAASSRASSRLQFAKRAGHALRREPAPGGGVLPRPRARARRHRRLPRSCRARSSPTTTSPTPTRPGSASRASPSPACVIVKHANPCGVAVGAVRARGLPQGLQDRSDLGLRRHHRLQPRGRRPRRREAIGEQFVEVLIAPGVDAGARGGARERSRTCACSRCRSRTSRSALDFKRVGGGLLVQTADDARGSSAAGLKVVTKQAPSDAADAPTCCSPGASRST